MLNEQLLDSNTNPVHGDTATTTPGSCCPPGAIGFAREDPNYVPKGKMITYEGVTAYATGSGTKCLIFIHDIYGLNSGLNKQHVDTLAEHLSDYFVVAPDFFPDGNLLGDDPLVERGSAVMNKVFWTILSCKICGFITRHGWDESSGDIFNKTTTYYLSQGVNSFSIIGFCWGAYVGFKACAEARHKDRILCNLSCHPSVHTIAPRFKEKEMEVVEAVNCPQLIASTKQEPAAWKPGGDVEKALSKKPFAALNEFYAYEEDHGLMTRGDSSKESTRLAIEDCLNKIVLFIKRFEKK
jgi:dienelactone hydrolase